MSDLAIETHSLHKHYGPLHAVDGLELRVPRGSIYGFLGRNGAGRRRPSVCLRGWRTRPAGRCACSTSTRKRSASRCSNAPAS